MADEALPHCRVCVIGAGPSGLATLRSLSQAGIGDIVCHEAEREIGGIWAYSPDPARPSVYETAHTISSRAQSQFAGFPMPAGYPDYPSNAQILSYLQAYAGEFGLRRFIRFGAFVEEARRLPDGRWLVAGRNGEGGFRHTADYLVVCSGHHRHPHRPDLPGRFAGTQIHSLDYRSAAGYGGKRVLVVGAGNSGCDIAAALSRVAAHVSLSLRGPQVIVHKLFLGRPVDVQFAKIARLPRRLRDHILSVGVALLVGPYAKYGLPQPDFPVLSRHPTLNTDVLEQIRHGRVKPRPGIRAADGSTVRFEDGSADDFDEIIWATGFRTELPFLRDVCDGWGDATRLPLFKKMMLADQPGLAFVGLIQPIGCIWVLAEVQARLVAAEISGRWRRPPDMAARIEKDLRRDARRFKASRRHALQVEIHEYRRELERLIAGGG